MKIIHFLPARILGGWPPPMKYVYVYSSRTSYYDFATSVQLIYRTNSTIMYVITTQLKTRFGLAQPQLVQ